jgi:hypothetical protein
MHAWRELGMTHTCLKTMGAGLDSDQAHVDVAATIRERYLRG